MSRATVGTLIDILRAVSPAGAEAYMDHRAATMGNLALLGDRPLGHDCRREGEDTVIDNMAKWPYIIFSPSQRNTWPKTISSIDRRKC
jgi:hypothetical protein